MKLEEFLVLDLKKRFGISREDADRIYEEARKAGNKEKASEMKRIIDCYEVQRILRLGVPPGRLLEKSCERCGENQVYCGYKDLGGVENYDNYWHICLGCLDAKHEESYSLYYSTWGSQAKDEIVVCPFCGYRWI